MDDSPDGKEQARRQPASQNDPDDRSELLFFVCIEIILGALANFLVMYLPIFIVFIIAMVVLAAYFGRRFILRRKNKLCSEEIIPVGASRVFPMENTIKEVRVWYLVRGSKMGEKIITFTDADNVYEKVFGAFPGIARRSHKINILGENCHIDKGTTFRSLNLTVDDVLAIT